MLLARGRFLRATLRKGAVLLELEKTALPDELAELGDAAFEVPLEKWNRVIKNVHSDRKLLGGLLLDFARDKERVSAVVGNDRLLSELQRVALDATTALVEEEILLLSVAAAHGEKG